MSDRPAILDELGRELVRAARADEARGTRARRVGRAPRTFVIGLLALLGLAAVAAAATLILGRGDPIPAPPPGLVPVELQPVPGTARLNGLDVRDPDGGPAWDVRTSRGRTGSICATVGQVHDGRLGLLGLDRRFRELPAGAADTCSREQSTGATLAGARAFRGGGRLGSLTVLSGVAAPSVRSAVAIADGRTTRMRLGPGHAFLAVLPGLPEELRPRVVLTEASGKRTTLRFADSGEFIAGDPSGGSPWTLDYSMGRDGLRCVRARRELGPDSGEFVRAPKRCGPRGEPFAAIRRFVPGNLGPPARGVPRDFTFSWGAHPARTVVWGFTPQTHSAVVLTGAGAPRRVRVDPGGPRRPYPSGAGSLPGGRGGFLAVLDGRVDPRRLRVTVDGRRLDPARNLDPIGRSIGREPVPAWRSVAAAAGKLRAARTVAIVPGSMTISRRAADPGGGPGWALRSWTIRLGASSRQPSANAPRACFAIGIARDGRLVEPLPGGRRRTVGTAAKDRVCPRPDLLAAGAGILEARTYVDDADAPDPRPVHVVVAGLLGDGSRGAELLGAGAARKLDLGRHGTFLVVLGPQHAGAPLRVRTRGRDGVRRTTRLLRSYGDRCIPTPGQSVRVADPDGGPSWTTGRGRAGRHACRYTGRAIGDRVATLPEGANWVLFDAPAGISFTRRPRASNRPLALHVTGPVFAALAPAAPGAPSPAQVARRTLRGPHDRLGLGDRRGGVRHAAHAARRAHRATRARRAAAGGLRRGLLRRAGARDRAHARRPDDHPGLPGEHLRMSAAVPAGWPLLHGR